MVNGKRTFIALLVALLAAVLGEFFSEDELVKIATVIVELGALAAAGWYRYRATKVYK